MPPKLTEEVITAAIEGFESQKRHIDEQILELRQMLNGGRPDTAGAPKTPSRNRRKLSAAARDRIAEAQRKRWAETKERSTPASQRAAPRKRRLSAAGRQRIAEASKARWARVRAEREKPGVKAPAKRSPGSGKKAAA